MAIERTFLGWNSHALAAAADLLIPRYTSDGYCDLSNVLIALPSRRAGRRFLEILLDACEQKGLLLSPPRMIPAGALPEHLCEFSLRTASDFERLFAWARAITSPAGAPLRQFVRDCPVSHSSVRAMPLAELFDRLHSDVAAEGLDFQGVAERLRRLSDTGPSELQRWDALAAVQAEYLKILADAGVVDRFATALAAVRQRACRCDRDVVLLGVSDLPALARQMLSQMDRNVLALVHAPAELGDRFDEFGCVIAAAWRDACVPLEDDQVRVVGGPADQAEAVADAIAELDGRYPADSITIGVADDSVAPYIEALLRQQGLETHYARRSLAGRSAPYMLLEAAADYLSTRSFRNFAALVRHPDVESFLKAQLKQPIAAPAPWLEEIDAYYNEHLPTRLDGVWLGDKRAYANLRAAYAEIENWLAPLGGGERPLSQWATPVFEALVQAYEHRELNVEDPTDAAVLAVCEQLRDAIQQFRELSSDLSPRGSATDAILLLLETVADMPLQADAVADAIEMVSWLDAPLDDSPALVLTGFNEGFVPSSVNGDMFLPNGLRSRLGFVDNDRRLARDVFALTATLHSRPSVKIICGRRTAENDPLLPSRLLFACDGNVLVDRVRLFWGNGQSGTGGRYRLSAGSASRFVVPAIQTPPKPIDSLRITAFRDFLACPYRFHLRHVLRLKAVADDAEELDGAGFGSLAHCVLERFGRSELRHSTNAEEIRRFLFEECQRLMAEAYGLAPLTALRVQFEQLQHRLAAFAEWQASWSAQGWQIEDVEITIEKPGVKMIVDGAPFYIHGRVDRVDVNRRTRECVVFDYKTSDSVKAPDKTHRQNDRWIDLQLPLYRHLLRDRLQHPPQLGYILLPKDTQRCGEALADWTDADLAEADATAYEVIRQLRRGVASAPVKPAPAFTEEFAAICQDGQYGGAQAELTDEDCE